MIAHCTRPAPALELAGVTAGYGPATVLHDVDLTVAPGSVVALLGANGAGKTTLLRVAAGLLRPAAGQVLAGGRDVRHRQPWQRSRAGLCLIPEGRGIFPNLTVRENLLLQSPAAPAKASVDIALEAFPVLAGRLGARAGELSGGQQQMLSLCRCFTSSPGVALLDEVSMGLAPIIVDQIFDALRKLAASGVALLLVEQYVGKALQLADRVYLLDRGSVTFSGSPDELEEDELVRRYLHVDTALHHSPTDHEDTAGAPAR
jgi:branched-chain amino acid transport system ATP-binding protein